MDLLGSLVPGLGGIRKKPQFSPSKTADGLNQLIEEHFSLVNAKQQALVLQQQQQEAAAAAAAAASADGSSTPVPATTAATDTTETYDKKLDENRQQLQKRIEEMKCIFYGVDADTAPKPDEYQVLTTIMIEKRILLSLIHPDMLAFIPFESRKQVTNVFCYLTDTDMCQFGKTHLRSNPDIVKNLSEGLENPELVIHCGAMLRSCFKYEFLHKQYLSDDMKLIDRFFDKYLVATDSFELLSEAFSTFSEIFSNHKKVVALFMEKNYTKFFQRYNKLILSGSYIAQRQSLKILSDLFLDSTKLFQEIMLKYIDDKENLKAIMTVMRVDSAPIQMEAFHIFKLFVANPHKNDAIKGILFKNKEKLIAYLENFLEKANASNKSSSSSAASAVADSMARYEQERKILIETLQALEVE